MKPQAAAILTGAAGAVAQSTSAAATVSTTIGATPTSTSGCVDGVHILVARGSNEDPGVGRVGTVADAVVERIPGSDIAALDYPATISDPDYFDSVHTGWENLAALLSGYVEACPDGKVVLMGYSQGAQVTADLVCGTSEILFEETEDLADKYNSNIVAVVMFGNPTHLANASWNAGTSTNDGLFPRQDPEGCTPYESKMRSWCDTGDIYCDAGNDTDVHGQYFDHYVDEAADWVEGRYQVFLESPEGTTATGTTTSGGGDDSATGTGTGAAGDSEETSSSGSDGDDGGDGESAGFRTAMVVPSWVCLALTVGVVWLY